MNTFSYETRISVLMNKYNFRFDKSLGQNFLIDDGFLQGIVDAASATVEDCVIEVGPGMGFMTEKLAKVAGQVVAIELDERLCILLKDVFAEENNIEIRHEDALKTDFSVLAAEMQKRGFEKPFKIVANLPYYITTPLLFYFLENSQYWTEMVLMVQKEVAERIVANPGGKDYGVLTVTTAYDADAEIVLNVPAEAFEPRPSVDSAVLRLTRRDAPPEAVADKKLFRAMVKASFGQRRKTLNNALKNSGLFQNKSDVGLLLEQCGIDGSRRGETLDFGEFAALTNTYINCFRGHQ